MFYKRVKLLLFLNISRTFQHLWSAPHENIASWIVGNTVGVGDPTIGQQVRDNRSAEPGLAGWSASC